MAGNTPVPDVVDAPTIGTATAGAEEATVTFTAATTGGAATTFGAISTPGSVTGTSATSPITVSGLTAGTAYTFKTYGINSSGSWSNVLSAASNSVTPSVATSYQSIESVTVGSGGSSYVEFTSIPATYTHLQIRAIVRSNRNTGDSLNVRFNSDTGSNYSYHHLYSNGSSAGSAIGSSATAIEAWANTIDNSLTANAFTIGIMDILDYTNTNKNTTVRSLQGGDTSGAGHVYFSSGLWMNTSAISTIRFYPAYGTGLMQYSQFALYGIKGA